MSVRLDLVVYRLKSQVRKIMKVLRKHGFFIVRIKGDHIIINSEPPLPRPIVIPNVRRVSNAVRLNLLKESGIPEEEFRGIF